MRWVADVFGSRSSECGYCEKCFFLVFLSCRERVGLLVCQLQGLWRKCGFAVLERLALKQEESPGCGYTLAAFAASCLPLANVLWVTRYHNPKHLVLMPMYRLTRGVSIPLWCVMHHPCKELFNHLLAHPKFNEKWVTISAS